MAAQIPKHRQLPDKESKLYKELLVQYEHKQYKKGLKAADTILRKFPNHGAASLPKQEEAEAMAKLAVKKDLTSHITWHVLGIMAKSRKDWAEASRAFAMAKKQDNDNLPILRDSIALFLHTRQYPAAVSARHQYFLLRPNLRSSWLGLMVAHQLNGDNEEALEVYDAMVGAMNTDGATNQEKAQILLNVIKVCMEMGEWEDGLRRLDRGVANGVISLRGEVSQLKAEMLKQAGRLQEAEDVYRSLLEQNADNHEYYRGFLRCKGLDIAGDLNDDARSKVLHHLDTFATSYPKSMAPRRLALIISKGSDFRDRVRPYLVDRLERGIPSLFVDVKSLYSDSEKMAAVGEVVEDIVETLQKDSSLHGDDTLPPPTTLLWAYYFLALHLSYPLHPSPSYKRSLDLLEIALRHTPTLPEVYMAKAMILKRAGDPQQAAEVMEEARLLDGQDRFLNGKAAKYWLRAGHVAKAEELLAMFTKEEAETYKRSGNLAMALKRYHNTITTFQDYEDDQYDFHTYCLRRMTISAYLALMRYEDQLRSHPAYFRAALGAIDIYTSIHDDPSLTEEKISPEEEAERKKAAKKAQKAEQKAKKAAAAAGETTKKEDAPVPDADPHGLTLIKTETPLDEALKVWSPLEKLAAGRIETWLAGYEVHVRRRTLIGAMKCLQHAFSLDSSNPTLHRQILHFRRINSTLPKSLLDSVSSTLSGITPPTSTASAQYNSTFLSGNANSAPHTLAAARGLAEARSQSVSIVTEVSPETRAEIITALNELASPSVTPSLDVILDAIRYLQSIGASAEELDAFKVRCKERLPLARNLSTSQEEAERKSALQNGSASGALANGEKADV